MDKIIKYLITMIVIAVGVLSIYDARIIANKFFTEQDINEATKVLKIVGTSITIIGITIIYIILTH